MTPSSSHHPGTDFSPPSSTHLPPDAATLLRAIRHHQRALQALQGISFKGISSDKTHQLRDRLQRELEQMMQQLHERPPEPPNRLQP